MRVRCRHCGAEYDAAITRSGLGLVDRCERCGRTGLLPVEEAEPAAGPGRDDPAKPETADPAA
jgi:hypothetical protein